MKKLNLTVHLLLVILVSCMLSTGCNNTQKPNDPSEGNENTQNEQGENYGAKGDDRSEPSQPGESTTSGAGQNTTGTDTTLHQR